MIAGGHAAFNPEPVADFLDVVVLGDGEQAVLAITDLIRDWKRAGQPGGRDGLLLRLSTIAYVPRFYDVTYHPDGTDFKSNSEPSRRTVRSFEIHRDGPGRVAVSAPAHRPGRGDRARAVQRGDLPRLHPRLPVLPGRDDHQAGAGAVHHHDRLDGRQRRGGQRLRRGRAALAVQRRPQRDQRDRGRPGRLLRGDQRRAVAAVHPGGCLQRDPRRRAEPERAQVRADVRPGGRAPSGCAR